MNIMRVVAFIKAVHKDYFDAFISKGELCMNTAEWFRNQEEIDSSVGDKWEGAVHIDGKEIRKVMVADVGVSLDDHDKWVEWPQGTVKNFSQLRQNANIFSLYAIIDSGHEDAIKHIVPGKYIKEFFNTHRFVYISNPLKFLQKMEEAITAIGKRMEHGRIKYYSAGDTAGITYLRMGMTYFWKRDKYSYQNEYRIIFNDKDAKKQILYLGPLDDICYEINFDVHAAQEKMLLTDT